MVHQHFMLIPVMTVAENIVLGVEPRTNLLLDERAARSRPQLSERFWLAVDPRRSSATSRWARNSASRS